MSTSILHPSGFIETQGCIGPRLIRNQPSREEPGILLNEVTDKYTTEFSVPYRDAYRTLKTLKKNWDLLDDNQKNALETIIGVNMIQEGPPIIPTPEPTLGPQQVKNLLRAITDPDPESKAKIMAEYGPDAIKEMYTEYNSWLFNEYRFFIIFVLCIFVFFLFIGIGIVV